MTDGAVLLLVVTGALAAGALVAAALGRRRLAYATLGAVAGAVLCVAAVEVRRYRTLFRDTRAGISVSIWGVEVLRREGGPGMRDSYSHVATILELGSLAVAALAAGACGERLATVLETSSRKAAGRA